MWCCCLFVVTNKQLCCLLVATGLTRANRLCSVYRGLRSQNSHSVSDAAVNFPVPEGFWIFCQCLVFEKMSILAQAIWSIHAIIIGTGQVASQSDRRTLSVQSNIFFEWKALRKMDGYSPLWDNMKANQLFTNLTHIIQEYGTESTVVVSVSLQT